MAADSPRRPRSSTQWTLWLALGAASFAALAWAAPAASADTYIAETSTTYLYTLDAANSPYVLSHDFVVLPGGTLYIGPGAQLHIENGSAVRAMGGRVAVEGTPAAPAVVRARPGALSPAWAGFDVGSGSELSLRYASLHGGTPAITMQNGSTLTMDGAAIDGCATWCVRVSAETNVSIVNATFADGMWGYLDNGSRGATGTNLALSNFSTAALTLWSGVADAAFDTVRVSASEAGVVVGGVSNVVFGRLQATVLDGAAFSGAQGVEVRVHNSSLTSIIGGAVEFDEPLRLRIESSNISGNAFALRVNESSYLALQSNRLSSLAGPCLELPGAVAASLVGNALVGCRVALSLPPGSVPPNATAGPSNTVDGRPFLWIDGGTGIVVSANATGAPGLVALFGVNGASLSDIELNGTGINLFGCTDVTLERVHIISADVGVTAVGTRGLRLIAYRAENVGRALSAWNDTAYPFPAGDTLIERSRVENATDAAFHFAGGSNITLRRVSVDGAMAAVWLEGVGTAMVANLLVRNVEFGIWVSNSTDVTVVDSAFEGAVNLGLLAANSTGVAARNAFVDNAMHASAPASPSFAFNELLAGNYWTNWTAPDGNGDGWADVPYNLSDGTGVDYRPRVVRWDFSPTAMVAARWGAEVGVASTLDARPSFDDFGITETYWEILSPGDDVTGQGPLFEWTPNLTGPHLVRLTVVGSLGATDQYDFPVVVLDTLPPSFTFAPLGRPEAGANITVVLLASDNDPAFPAFARVEWLLFHEDVVRGGEANGTTFDLRITQTGLHTLVVTLFDGAGNGRTASVEIDVGDTTGPEIHIAFEGQPDIGLPFVLDAAATFDPSGLDSQNASWTWVEAGTSHEANTFPVAEITLEHPGNITVTLHVCDGLGNCGQAQVLLVVVDSRGPRLVRIHVVAPQRDAVDITPGQPAVVSVRAGDEVVFEITAEDASGNVTFQWDFGDGTTAEGARVIHRFARTGEVTVLVTMSDPLGNTNPAAVRVRVEPGGFLFGEIIPGVSGDLVVLLLVVGGAAAIGFVMMRRRKARRGRNPDAEQAPGQAGR